MEAIRTRRRRLGGVPGGGPGLLPVGVPQCEKAPGESTGSLRRHSLRPLAGYGDLAGWEVVSLGTGTGSCPQRGRWGALPGLRVGGPHYGAVAWGRPPGESQAARRGRRPAGGSPSHHRMMAVGGRRRPSGNAAASGLCCVDETARDPGGLPRPGPKVVRSLSRSSRLRGGTTGITMRVVPRDSAHWHPSHVYSTCLCLNLGSVTFKLLHRCWRP
jgi:hypothetical protein